MLRYFTIFFTVYLCLITPYYLNVFAARLIHHAVVTLVLLIWLIARVRRGGLPVTPLNGALLLTVIVWIASTVFSLDPRMSLEHLWFPVTHLLFFLIIVDYFQRGREKVVWEALLLTSALVVIVAFAQFIGWLVGSPLLSGTSIGWLDVAANGVPFTPPRVFFPFGVSTWLAAFAALLTLIAFVWSFGVREAVGRLALRTLTFGSFITLLLTGSRGGYAALVIMISAFILIRLISSGRLVTLWRRYRIVVIGVALAGIGAALLIAILFVGDSSRLSGDLLRLDLWRSAVSITADQPLLGAGVGMFGRAHRLYRDPTNVDDRLGVAHNLYLNTAAETGVIGLAVLVFSSAVFARAWWVQWRSATERRRLRLEGALAALIGFAAQSFVDTFTLTPILLVPLALIAYCVTEPNNAPTHNRTHRLAAVAALIAVLFSGAGWLISDHAQNLFRMGVNGDREAAQAAVDLEPHLRLYSLQLAYMDGLIAPTHDAILSYQHALELESTWDVGWINLAGLYMREGEVEAALTALGRARAISQRSGAPLLWAQIAESHELRDADATLEAYIESFSRGANNSRLLSPYWWQTPLRQAALEAVLMDAAFPPDLRYRIYALHNPERAVTLVPSDPVSAADWWITAEYLLTTRNDPQAAETAFTRALAAQPNPVYRGDYYAARARARLTFDPLGALADLDAALHLGTVHESSYLIRARLAADDQTRVALLAAGVPPKIVEQNFEGVLFGGRVADFTHLPEVSLPGPGAQVLKAWYELAELYAARGDLNGAANVYSAILNRGPDESAARDQLAALTNGDDS